MFISTKQYIKSLFVQNRHKAKRKTDFAALIDLGGIYVDNDVRRYRKI